MHNKIDKRNIRDIAKPCTANIKIWSATLLSLCCLTIASAGVRVIKNPYADVEWESVNAYKANLHCHTIYSDGTAEPKLLIENYASAGYSILAIADHSNLYTHREGERNPGPSKQTTWPWTRWIDDEPSVINTRGEMETSAFYPTLGENGMLAINASELCPNPHMVSLFNDLGHTPSGYSQEQRIESVAERGGLGIWAHPALYTYPNSWAGHFGNSVENALEFYGRTVVAYDHMLGIEFNQNDLGPRRNEAMLVYNELLQRHYRDHDIFAFANDDSHATYVADDAVLTIVLALDLTETAVRNAMESGHIFAGRRTENMPVFKGIHVDEDANTITVSIENHDRIRWIKDGEKHSVGDHLDYSQIEDSIVRFEVDVNESIFYSQAFHIAVVDE